jgi:hypothetical protein
MNSSYVIANLLDKLSKIDSDFRFMGVSDLKNELEKPEFNLDFSTESKVIDAVLKSLKDSNSEVQNMAVKWFVGLLTLALHH